MNMNIRLIFFVPFLFVSACSGPGESSVTPTVVEPSETPAVKSRIVPEKISSARLMIYITKERCARWQQTAFNSQCITLQELEDCREWNAAPWCEEGELSYIFPCEQEPERKI